MLHFETKDFDDCSQLAIVHTSYFKIEKQTTDKNVDIITILFVLEVNNKTMKVIFPQNINNIL